MQNNPTAGFTIPTEAHPANPDSFVGSASDERTVNNTMRHQYRVLTDVEKAQMTMFKDMGATFLNYIDAVTELGGPRREYALAKTKIEEAVMWAVKGITA